jgi:toluene monooxygenase system ferredoxin subunit
MLSFCRAASLDDLWVGEIKSIRLRGREVLLANLEGDVMAFENRCGHKGLPLDHGDLAGCIVTCPAHGWQYDLSTGQGINPERARLKRFAVKLVANEILVGFDGDEADAAG